MMKDLFIPNDSTIYNALVRMDRIGRKLLIVIDSSNAFIGLVSIGDIQRAILSKIDLSAKVELITKKDAIVADKKSSLNQIKQLMLEIRAEFIPVVGSKGEITRIYFWEEIMLNEKITNGIKYEAVGIIMAGGKGTRMSPISDVIPKPLMPINGHSFIEEILQRYAKHGIKRSYISLGHEAELIQFYLSNKSIPYNIDFIVENKPLGTIGSLSLIRENLKEVLVLSNCDILVDLDIQELITFHKNKNNCITVVSAIYREQSAYGEFEIDGNGRIIQVKEKSSKFSKINTGMYVIEPEIIKKLSFDEYLDITTLLTRLISDGEQIGIFPVSEIQWRDFGTLDKYLYQSKL